MLYGHSLPGQPESKWQTLDAHHSGVAQLASSFADFGLSETAGLLGGTHDIGKCSEAFQNRLRGKGGKVDHTTAACLHLLEEWKNSLQTLLDKEAFGQRRLLRAFPKMRSTDHKSALERLRRWLEGR